MSEREKLLRGEVYNSRDDELIAHVPSGAEPD
ncbi:Uncharacterised protein [Serratia fonticola]|uniref:Uncharacterized protein n=1 Tax=Serratia fonticola TaxID=47917 RepID=A0A4U9TJZ0_SERFO|nr:Uncharacterised protein [Serratia fonticola]